MADKKTNTGMHPGLGNWDSPIDNDPGKAQPIPAIDLGGFEYDPMPRNTLGLPIVDEKQPRTLGPKV